MEGTCMMICQGHLPVHGQRTAVHIPVLCACGLAPGRARAQQWAGTTRLPVRACPPLPAPQLGKATEVDLSYWCHLIHPGPGLRMSRTTSYYVLTVACMHQGRVRATTHRPERAEAWAGWPCGSPAHMWWILDAGHTMTPPSVSPPSTETSADLH